MKTRLLYFLVLLSTGLSAQFKDYVSVEGGAGMSYRFLYGVDDQSQIVVDQRNQSERPIFGYHVGLVWSRAIKGKPVAPFAGVLFRTYGERYKEEARWGFPPPSLEPDIITLTWRYGQIEVPFGLIFKGGKGASAPLCRTGIAPGILVFNRYSQQFNDEKPKVEYREDKAISKFQLGTMIELEWHFGHLNDANIFLGPSVWMHIYSLNQSGSIGQHNYMISLRGGLRFGVR